MESYVQWDPMRVLRTGSVPFWSRFNMEPAYEELERYLEATGPYDAIYLNLFSQGIESPGVVPVERWEKLIQQHAREHGEVVGVDSDTYPMDAGSTIRFNRAFRSIDAREPLPAPMAVEEINEFLAESSQSYKTQWI